MKMLPYTLFEKYIYSLALEIASAGNQHCANCIGTLSFGIRWLAQWVYRAKPREPHDSAVPVQVKDHWKPVIKLPQLACS